MVYSGSARSSVYAQDTAMLIVGLTGGIATGKSTVTKLLRKHSVTVLDCDEIAHAIVIKVTKQAEFHVKQETS